MCKILSYLEIWFGVHSPASVRKIGSSGLLKMQFFISESHASQHPTYCSLRCWGMLSVRVPPISTLDAITTMKSMPSSARGGLASAIKLKFRFWLITGEECDREGNAYSLTHANGCNKQPATSPPVWEPGRPCHSDLRVFAGLFRNITEVWQ